MLRRLIIAIAVASALGISFCPTDASACRTRAAEASQAGIKPQAAAPQPRLHTAERPVKD